MRRILLLGVMALLTAVLMMASAFPAFGAANRHASCVGAAHSRQAEPGKTRD